MERKYAGKSNTLRSKLEREFREKEEAARH